MKVFYENEPHIGLTLDLNTRVHTEPGKPGKEVVFEILCGKPGKTLEN